MGTLLDDSESSLFDSVASDMAKLAGEQINYYSMNRPRTKIDPLYGEAVERSVDGPYRVPAWVKWPISNAVADEHGFGFEFDGEAVIPRAELDKIHAPYPFEGDIIEMWRTPFHDADSLGKGLFFDVIRVQNDGHINDSPTFVQFRVTLKRRTQFGAERRITPP